MVPLSSDFAYTPPKQTDDGLVASAFSERRAARIAAGFIAASRALRFGAWSALTLPATLRRAGDPMDTAVLIGIVAPSLLTVAVDALLAAALWWKDRRFRWLAVARAGLGIVVPIALTAMVNHFAAGRGRPAVPVSTWVLVEGPLYLAAIILLLTGRPAAGRVRAAIVVIAISGALTLVQIGALLVARSG